MAKKKPAKVTALPVKMGQPVTENPGNAGLSVLTLAQLKGRPGRHVIIPVTDGRFAPMVRQGDFVVVDVERRDICINAMVWLRYRGGDTSFAVIRGAAPTPFKGVSIAFGGQKVHYLNGKSECWQMGDVIPEEYLRECIAGHVVGVIGTGLGVFNWTEAA